MLRWQSSFAGRLIARYDGTVVQGVDDNWDGKAPKSLQIKSLGLGWLDVSGSAYTAWFDDVAVSSSRIGCQ